MKEENKRLHEREKYLEQRRTDIINKFQNEITDTTIPKSKVKALITQIESAIDYMKTDKTEIKVDKNKQQEEDLRLEIMHLRKLMEDK